LGGENACWPLLDADDRRDLGRPILEGVSTEIIAAEVAANNNDEDAIARCYEIPGCAVRAALEYEASLRADKRLAVPRSIPPAPKAM
jgi:uncharacterized protein (DUF433 family)